MSRFDGGRHAKAAVKTSLPLVFAFFCLGSLHQSGTCLLSQGMLVSEPGIRPARPARSRVLRLRGLPYRAVEDDILLFLAPLAVTRVEICRRNGGYQCSFRR